LQAIAGSNQIETAANMTADEINNAVGRRLAQRRRELNLSLAQLSARCGVSLQQVHKYEIGQTGLTVAMLVRLSRCLDTPVSYFLEGVEDLAQS
jgi:transcriptional regulator with XRE-family HTH domain